MKNNKIFNFIVDIIPSRGLISGVDFDVSSFFVFDFRTFKIISIDKYYKLNSLSLLKDLSYETSKQLILREIQKVSNNDLSIELQTTTLPCSNSYFYKMSSDLNADIAIQLGFGIVKMKTGPFKGEFLIYNAKDICEEEPGDEARLAEELLLLKIYLQLTENNFHEPRLEYFLEDPLEFFLLNLIGDINLLYKRLSYAIDSKRGEIVILQSKRKNTKRKFLIQKGINK
jgi:hypothetical protein